MTRPGSGAPRHAGELNLDDRPTGDLDALEGITRDLSRYGVLSEPGDVDLDLPGRIALDPERVEQGLARLVLSLIELLRRLMERQAIRRIDAGSLSDDEIERLGETFLKLDEKMQELKAAFGLQDDDLNINLGPLGDLM